MEDITKHLQQYMLSKPETKVDFPFDETSEVYKVKNKMFAILGSGKKGLSTIEGADESRLLNLKCDPDEAVMLRDIFAAVIPAYHMNKTHWNSIILNGSVPLGEIERMIDNSFKLVVSKMTKKDQASIMIHL